MKQQNEKRITMIKDSVTLQEREKEEAESVWRYDWFLSYEALRSFKRCYEKADLSHGALVAGGILLILRKKKEMRMK